MAKQYLMPYTNLHELNLDWLINAMKQLESQWDAYGTEVSATVESLPSGSKAEIEVTGSLKDHMNFGFKIPSGDTGTTFYPEVSKEGIISWYNEDGKQNPPSVNIKGPQGAQGPAGSGLFILDTYATLDELKAAHPTGLSGNAYLIGTAPNFVMYVWSTDRSEWTNSGSIVAPPPSTSAPLQDADVSSTGVENAYARGDHAHPHDDTKLDKASSDETSVYGVSGNDQILFPFSTFATDSELELKQDKLVSGTNIKTINDQIIIGEGNITTKWNAELMWTNASTEDTSFPAQVISIDLSQFEYVALEMLSINQTPTVDSTLFVSLHKINESGAVYFPYNFIYCRHFSILEKSISFSDGFYYNTFGSDNTVVNNYFLIPYKIYGIY